jgi:5-formyltetrahydrofolate cyclo-ligase
MAGQNGPGPPGHLPVMSAGVAEQKQALRRLIREREQKVSPEQKAAASARLCDRLRLEPVWQESRRILSFLPMAGEPDVRPLLEEALATKETVALPRYNAQRGDYDICLLTGLASLEPGHFGILEPGAGCPVLRREWLDFVLVPGLAYDMMGRRLGRGKGYFDRLLAGVQGHKCGVAFDWQVVEEVPVEGHDVGVHSLLTPSRFVRCAG